MAIANYTDLQGAVADWLARSDLTSRIPDFILMAEGRFNRKLRTREMEASSSVSLTAGAGVLPVDYLEWISGTWVGARTQDLRFVEADSEDWRRRFRPNGDPQVFTVLAGSVRVRPVPSGVNTVTLFYYQKIPPLVSSATNWLMTKYPDLYIYTTCAEALMFVKDDERLARAVSLIEPAMQTVLFDADSGKQGRRPGKEAEVADQQRALTNAGM